MNRIFLPLFGGILLLTSSLFAGRTIEEEPVAEVFEETKLIALTTHTWTRIPPASVGNLSKRNGIVVNDPSFNTGNFGLTTSTGTNTPGNPIGVYEHEITPAGPDREFIIGEAINLWAISLDTGTENAMYREWRQ